MTQKALVFESKKCIGCRLCEQICSMTHFQVTNPAKSRIRIFRNDREQVDWVRIIALVVGNALINALIPIQLCTPLKIIY